MGCFFLADIEVTALTSGALARIMDIDFGIQVTKRFRVERQSHEREEAMVNTLTLSNDHNDNSGANSFFVPCSW